MRVKRLAALSCFALPASAQGKAGSADVQFRPGMICRNRPEVPQDDAEAARWPGTARLEWLERDE